MKLLADENFSAPIVEAPGREGHDVLWVRVSCSGLKDLELFDRAETEGRVVLTLDRDFWQLALQRPKPLKQSRVVLFRVHPAIPKKCGAAGRFHASCHEWIGHVTIITPDGIEIIPARRE